jgi:acyl-CoA synthetase (AMP-forming)/AMP-acid ligase II
MTERDAPDGSNPFWTRLAERGDAPALLCAAGAWSYAELAAAVEAEAMASYGASRRGLVMLAARNDRAGVVRYLACLAAGWPVMLIKPEITPEDLQALLDLYQPRVTIMPAGDDYAARWRDGPQYPIHPDLALLLSTSGSVGAPKAVRLSAANVAVNARQIARTLRLRPDERAALTMPLYYAYGLSVLHSQMEIGASVWIDSRSAVDPGLWRDLAANGVTSFHAVPMTYQMLQRLNQPVLDPMRRLTQAGGRLPDDANAWLTALAARTGAELWKMYGMTEATARIAVLPPERLTDKPGSVGLAIEGGRIEIGPAREVIYRGPNVMMGYARSYADLALGDEMGGVIVSADRGRLDADGALYVEGRMDRTVKLMGLRIDLDDVENFMGPDTAAVFDGERLRIFSADADLKPRAAALARKMRVPPHAVGVEALDALPRTGSGKVDYRALNARVRTGPPTA